MPEGQQAPRAAARGAPWKLTTSLHQAPQEGIKLALPCCLRLLRGALAAAPPLAPATALLPALVRIRARGAAACGLATAAAAAAAIIAAAAAAPPLLPAALALLAAAAAAGAALGALRLAAPPPLPRPPPLLLVRRLCLLVLAVVQLVGVGGAQPHLDQRLLALACGAGAVGGARQRWMGSASWAA